MIKSALIIGLVMLLLGIGASLISPLCVPCLALFAGLGAGYLAGSFERPLNNGAAAKNGALSGALAGIGALLGQGVGAVINGVNVGPEQAADLMRQFGFDMPSMSDSTFQASYWLGVAGSACCIGLLDAAVMAGLGALGGLLWWQITGKPSTVSSDI